MSRPLISGLIALLAIAGCAAPAGDRQSVAPPVATASQLPSTPAPPASPVPPTPSAAPSATAIPPTATAAPLPPTATAAPLPPTATAAPPVGEQEILFLRGGDLIAFGLRSRAERTVARGVRAFAATPDGGQLAMLRGPGRSGEIWLARRDGGEARQITSNARAEAELSWAPDGSALAYSSAPSDDLATLDWAGWSRWCAAAELRLIELRDLQERSLAPGCGPAFGPDSKRIAFASPPAAQPAGLAFLGANNAVRLINRQGQNGWSLATADGQGPEQGYLVYAPAWAPSGEQLAYQRFLGYQALVDINITEISPAFRGDGKPLTSGAGWMLPPQFAPGGQLAAVIEHNAGDARGGSGYEVWRIALLRLGVAGSMFLPSGEISTVGSLAWQAPRVTAAAWSPDGERLALALPAGWSDDAPAQELIYQSEGPGEVWLWGVDGAAQELLIAPVDYASPLLWLPGQG